MPTRLLVTKTIPDVTNSYPHGNSYNPCQWMWQCHHREKWKFTYLTYLAYLAKERVPMSRALMMTSQKGRWQMFSGLINHHQINPSTMDKPMAFSHACWPIHHKEWRGATNKIVQSKLFPSRQEFGTRKKKTPKMNFCGTIQSTVFLQPWKRSNKTCFQNQIHSQNHSQSQTCSQSWYKSQTQSVTSKPQQTKVKLTTKAAWFEVVEESQLSFAMIPLTPSAEEEKVSSEEEQFSNPYHLPSSNLPKKLKKPLCLSNSSSDGVVKVDGNKI